jgi:hypothetical protein
LMIRGVLKRNSAKQQLTAVISLSLLLLVSWPRSLGGIRDLPSFLAAYRARDVIYSFHGPSLPHICVCMCVFQGGEPRRLKRTCPLALCVFSVYTAARGSYMLYSSNTLMRISRFNLPPACCIEAVPLIPSHIRRIPLRMVA